MANGAGERTWLGSLCWRVRRGWQLPACPPVPATGLHKQQQQTAGGAAGLTLSARFMRLIAAGRSSPHTISLPSRES